MYDTRFDPPDPPVRLAVVLCTDTDDYVPPEGVRLPSGAPFRFSSLLAAVECPPGVEVGTVYLVYATGPQRGFVVMEMLDQDCDGAPEQRRLMCREARKTGNHTFRDHYGRRFCSACGLPQKRTS